MEFFGAYQHRIDAKGRVALPAVFRDGFGEERVCYIAAETSQRCLTVYPADEFKLMVGRLQEAKREGRFTQRQLTNFMAAVSQSSIDAQGRINLPEHLRDFSPALTRTPRSSAPQITSQSSLPRPTAPKLRSTTSSMSAICCDARRHAVAPLGAICRPGHRRSRVPTSSRPTRIHH